MGLFGIKENEVTGIIKNEIESVKADNSHEIKMAQLALQKEMSNQKSYTDEGFKDIREQMAIMLKQLNELKSQTSIDVAVNDNSGEAFLTDTQEGDYTDDYSICRALNFKGFTPTLFKYFLYENGIFEMNIHEHRNTFSLKAVRDESSNMELMKMVHKNKSKSKITYSKEIIPYLFDKKDEILKSIKKYEAKQEQYKISRKKLETKNVINYQDEINAICGISKSGSYNEERWGLIYNIFRKSFPTFEDDVKKYRKEHSEDRYPITKVKYVVSVMTEGNYLLKIACDLFA